MDSDETVYRLEDRPDKTPEEIEEDVQRLQIAMRTGPGEILEKIRRLEAEVKKEKENG